MTPALSRRVAAALHALPRGRLGIIERIKLADEVEGADTFEELPDWVKDIVLEGDVSRAYRHLPGVRAAGGG